MKDLFDADCETGLYPLKFHVHGQLRKTLDYFGCLERLSSSPYKCFKAHLKRAYCSFPMRRISSLEETLLALVMITHKTRQEVHKTRMIM